MVLLAEFLKELGAAHFNATVVEIISDDCKVPSERLRLLAKSRLPIVKSNTSQANSSLLSHYSSGRNHQASARRSLGRHHSEPIRIFKFPASASVTATALSRWTPNLLPGDKRDQRLVAPERSGDRWGVTRNKSDSALLSSILPKRTQCMAVTKTVLCALERKCSASKVISEMVHVSTSRLRTPDEAKQIDPEFALEASDPEDGIIEQLIEVPGETRRREQEGKERFIRSILDVSGATKNEEIVYEEEEEVASSTPRCITTRKVVGGVQAMMGFLLLIVQIISVELLGPVFLNANQLFQTFMESIPDSEKGYDLVIPLFGVVPALAKVAAIATDGSTISQKRIPPSSLRL
jgi:hypothetical protein